MAGKTAALPPGATFDHEERLYQRGFHLIAGIDEVGRGPLAGPVVAAAVVFPRGVGLPGVMDSKKLTAFQRERLSQIILAEALDFGVGCVQADEIDRINILQSTFKAMMAAVHSLRTPPDHLLIDGPYRLPMPISQNGIPKGDQVCASIAAASIVAKVHRDRMMMDYDLLYPAYGFGKHKGYGTAAHCRAIEIHGPCPIHRRSFRRVMDTKGQGPEKTMATRQSKGKQGEEMAAAFLLSKGMTILEANVRCAMGELDLVCRHEQTIVFVEVRTRYSRGFGLAQESVIPSKQRKLTLLAKWYLQRHRMLNCPARFDVVAIDFKGREPEIVWIPNAFDACE